MCSVLYVCDRALDIRRSSQKQALGNAAVIGRQADVHKVWPWESWHCWSWMLTDIRDQMHALHFWAMGPWEQAGLWSENCCTTVEIWKWINYSQQKHFYMATTVDILGKFSRSDYPGEAERAECVLTRHMCLGISWLEELRRRENHQLISVLQICSILCSQCWQLLLHACRQVRWHQPGLSPSLFLELACSCSPLLLTTPASLSPYTKPFACGEAEASIWANSSVADRLQYLSLLL